MATIGIDIGKPGGDKTVVVNYEPPRPVQAYNCGDRVVVSTEVAKRLIPPDFWDSVYSQVRNYAVITGVRWGADETKIMKPIWVYTVRAWVDIPPEFGVRAWVDVFESRILDLIERKQEHGSQISR